MIIYYTLKFVFPKNTILLFFLLFFSLGTFAQTINVQTPNGREDYRVGLTYDISWSVSGGTINNVVIEYSTDNGLNWSFVNDGSPIQNTGTYLWTVPNPGFISSGQITQALIRISDAADLNPTDVSDLTFRIFLPSYNGANLVRILPLGDSITYGSDNLTNFPNPEAIADKKSYRSFLFDSLNTSGYNFDFVGGEVGGSNFFDDTENGGYPGINTGHLNQIMNNGFNGDKQSQETPNGQPYLSTFPTEIILLHIGTNGPTLPAVNDVESVLDQVDTYEFANNKEVWVILALIINRSPFDQATADYNDALYSMAINRIYNSNDKIIIVDMENGTGINYTIDTTPPFESGDMIDNIHPNDSGREKMGNLWYSALQNLLGQTQNHIPVIKSQPDTNGVVGVLYSYNVSSTGKPTPSFSLLNAPSGMTINSSTGLIEWIPGFIGSFDIQVQASNSQGTSQVQSFTIDVKKYPAGMTHYWKLEEQLSWPYFDSYGETEGVENKYPPEPVTGKVGFAQYFDTTSNGSRGNRITVRDDNSFEWGADSSFSIECWFNVNSFVGTQTIIGRRRHTAPFFPQWRIGITNFGTIEINLSSTAATTFLDTTVLVLDEWYHIVLNRDAIADKIYLYLNGNLKLESNLAPASSFILDGTNNTPLTIGSWRATSSGSETNTLNPFDGIIDEVAIYNRALTSDEISQHYSNGLLGIGYEDNNSPTVPSIDSIYATSIGQTSAILNAEINAGNQSSIVRFQWDTDSLSWANNQPALNSPLLFNGSANLNISGLVPNTTYFFRSYVSNVSGSDTSFVRSFITLPNQTVFTDTFYMSASADDIMYYNGSSSGNISRFGESSNIYRGLEQIYKNITIPQNAEILLASLEFKANVSRSGNTAADIYSDLRDNPAVVMPFSEYNTNTNFSSTSFQYIAPAYTAGIFYQIDITSIIQNRVDNPNWSNGDNLGMIIKGNTILSTDFREITRAENSLSDNKLIITYSTEAVELNAPSIDSIYATSLAQTTVTLNAEINAGNQSTVVRFQWNTDSLTWANDQASTNSPLGGDGLATLNITGLTLNTTYYYRVYVNNASGSDTSFVKSFITPDIPAAVTDTFYMSLGTDDYMYYNGAANSSVSRFGESGNLYRGIEQLFKNVTLPQNAEIISAQIEVKANTTNSGTAVSDIYSDLRDNPAGVMIFSEYNTNTNFSLATLQYSAPSFTAGSFYQIDITNVIQDRVSNPNWTNGDNLGIIIKGNPGLSANSYREITRAENSLNDNKLIITYASGEATAPSIDSIYTTSLAQTSVTLNAEINAGNQATTIRFQWDTDSNAVWVNDQLAANSPLIADGIASRNLTGLNPNTTYFYRAYLTNASGNDTSFVKTFTTPDVSSAVTDTFYMSLAADDYMYYNGSANSSVSRFGESSNIYRGLEQIYKSITIPQNAQIVSALLEVKANVSRSGNAVADIYSDLRDNPTAMIYSEFNTNTNFSSVSFQYNTPVYTVNTFYQIDITNVIQDRVNKPDWTNADNMGIIIKGNTSLSSDYREITRAENSLTDNKLIITYEPALPKLNTGNEVEVMPDKYELFQNYPNPFNPSTTIKFGLPDGGRVRLDIFNVIGENVRTLLNGEMSAGYQNIIFDAGNLPSGIYIYRIMTENFSQTKKMLLIK